MNLEQIQEQLISDFDFDRALEILTKLNEEYTKDDLINNAKTLIKMAYTSREMDDILFSSGYLVVTRNYYEGIEVNYSLNFSIDISSNVQFDLEKPFVD